MRQRPAVLAATLVVATALLANLTAISADSGRPAAAVLAGSATPPRATGTLPGTHPQQPAPSPDSESAPRSAYPAVKPPTPITTIPAGGGAVALTFDDGPDPRFTPYVLALLAAYHLHATFCLVGIHVREHPNLVRQIVAAGHSLCNHTFNHEENVGLGTPAQIAANLRATDDAIVAAAGVRPRYFRAPAGKWTPALLAAVAADGMVPLDWSADPRDWARPGVPSIVATALAELHPGGILLMHDGFGHREQSVAALRALLPALLARRMHPVPL